MKKIPLFIFEEHHEAFFIWNYAVMNKMINSSNNILLHVDEHSDMSVPKFNHSIKSIEDDLISLYKFTYNELTIANFIVPAIYQGIFSQLYWLYQSNNEGKKGNKKLLVHSQRGEGKDLIVDPNDHLKTLSFFNPDFKSFFFNSVKTDNQLLETQGMVLDIDLDYFSCNPPSLNYQGILEITEDQYYSFNRDKYHNLHLMFGSGIQSRVKDGKYYLVFESSHSRGIYNQLKVSEKEISKRIDNFIQFLLTNKIEPQIIDICRSRISGFTPADQCQFIEQELLKGLSSIYNVEINNIEEIIAEEKLEMIGK
ncbi:MAG: UPF0489 family protein [Xenococcaceae cyanobacterium MO_188.B32]|nr:UPF0489 family protein [Xenococcaceae cyanobacterium MO_188.B32]